MGALAGQWAPTWALKVLHIWLTPCSDRTFQPLTPFLLLIHQATLKAVEASGRDLAASHLPLDPNNSLKSLTQRYPLRI